VLVFWAKAKADGTNTTGSPLPSFPKVGWPNCPRLRLFCVANPKQLKIAVGEEETTTRCALSRMDVGWSLGQTKCRQTTGFRAAARGADEDMVKFKCHFGPSSVSYRPRIYVRRFAY